jgi:predicted short-subunit dehydrogenase-like oxidoreductase (DUF2520 family)
MKIVIIGSGNVATHLAKALYAANLQVTEIWSHQYENALALATQVKATAIENLNQIDLNADLCLLAVKDDAIAGVSLRLKGFKGTIAHTSGAVDIAIFAGNFEKYGVFYPLQTFSKAKEVSFNDIPLCLEANNAATYAVLSNVAKQLSKTVLEVNTEKRAILHLSAVFACNFVNHFYVLADEVLGANELDFNLIKPLIMETAFKVQNARPIDVQTGPAIRNDEKTMAKHESLLVRHPQLIEIYRIVSDRIKKTR